MTAVDYFWIGYGCIWLVLIIGGAIAVRLEWIELVDSDML